MSVQPPGGGELADLVEDDIIAGFEELFPAVEGFDVAAPFERDDASVTNGRLGVLAWTWNGVHSVTFNGLAPTGQTVTVRGVTIVEQTDGGGLLFHRYIDWNDVAGQLGLAFVGRPSVPELVPQPDD